MRVMKKAMAAIMCICMAVFMVMPVFAAGDSTNIISDARKGVLQFRMYYQDKKGQKYPLQSSTCFLINDKMIATCAHSLYLDEASEKTAKEVYGIDFENSESLPGKFKYEVVVKRDVVLEATILQQSDAMDFAVLSLPSQIFDRTPLALADSEEVSETDNVFALGFPGAALGLKDIQYYTWEDVTITTGIVSLKDEVTQIPSIQHSAKISEGSSGGPLLNEQGQVVGINRGADGTGDYSVSTQINELTSILDSFGYAYTKGDGSASVTTEPEEETEEANSPETELLPEETESMEAAAQPEEDVTVQANELSSAIEAARDMDLDNCTEESAELFRQALEKAEEILEKENPTKAELVAATSDLKAAGEGLEEAKGPNMAIIIGIAAAAVVVVILVVVLVVNSSKKNKKKTASGAAPAGAGSMGAGPVRGGYGMPPVNKQPSFGPDPGETSVLDAGAGETTLLSAGQGSATLTRKKTGEKVALVGNIFAIGKERGRVNYCISDNTSISRVHAKIVRKGADYYIVDQNSTNATYINGRKLEPRQETKLADGDSVKLSDETFEFKLN